MKLATASSFMKDPGYSVLQKSVAKFKVLDDPITPGGFWIPVCI